MNYKHTTTTTAIGVCHEFHGPKLPRHANGVHLAPWEGRDGEADRIVQLLALAFEAGRQAKAAEIRAALDVREPFGPR